MKEKSYRVDKELVEKASAKKLEYIKETNMEISERKIINALISKGIEKATTKDIQDYIDTLDK